MKTYQLCIVSEHNSWTTHEHNSFNIVEQDLQKHTYTLSHTQIKHMHVNNDPHNFF